MDPDADPVVVIGAGPVGQTAALAARALGPAGGRAGRGAPTRDPVGSRAICQQRDVLDIWDAVGAGRGSPTEGVTWTTARTFYRDRELFASSFVDRGRSPLPPFVNISQARTEEILDERDRRGTPLVEMRWGHGSPALEPGRRRRHAVTARTAARGPRVRTWWRAPARAATTCAAALGVTLRRARRSTTSS